MKHQRNYSVESVVANRSGAMETETISKNGRSSKSHTSRRDLFKTVFMRLLGVMIVLSVGMAFSGCEKNKEGEKPEFPEYQWKLMSISLINDSLAVESTIDYAEENIIYEVNSGNVLSVSGDVGDSDYRGIEMGTHIYKVLNSREVENEAKKNDWYEWFVVGYGYGYGEYRPYGYNVVRINNVPYVFYISYGSGTEVWMGMETLNKDKGKVFFAFSKVG